jgi:transposase
MIWDERAERRVWETVTGSCPCSHLHFTPTASSWLNRVERWFAELTNRKLRRPAHRNVAELEADVHAWIDA